MTGRTQRWALAVLSYWLLLHCAVAIAAEQAAPALAVHLK